jgi:hypothetical protein
VSDFNYDLFLKSWELLFAEMETKGDCDKRCEGSNFYIKSNKNSLFNVGMFRALEGMLSRWSRLHLQSLAPTNPTPRGEL